MSNEQRAPGWLGYIGDDKLPSHIGIFYEAIIRIPISQPVQPKLYSKVFFSWAQMFMFCFFDNV